MPEGIVSPVIGMAMPPLRRLLVLRIEVEAYAGGDGGLVGDAVLMCPAGAARECSQLLCEAK